MFIRDYFDNFEQLTLDTNHTMNDGKPRMTVCKSNVIYFNKAAAAFIPWTHGDTIGVYKFGRKFAFKKMPDGPLHASLSKNNAGISLGSVQLVRILQSISKSKYWDVEVVDDVVYINEGR